MSMVKAGGGGGGGECYHMVDHWELQDYWQTTGRTSLSCSDIISAGGQITNADHHEMNITLTALIVWIEVLHTRNTGKSRSRLIG